MGDLCLSRISTNLNIKKNRVVSVAYFAYKSEIVTYILIGYTMESKTSIISIYVCVPVRRYRSGTCFCLSATGKRENTWR